MRTARIITATLALVIALAAAVPAWAAWPGADGLLAVQPPSDRGLVLVAPDGHGARRICIDRAICGAPRRPRWSPDGRALVFTGPALRIVYADGSCLNCDFGLARAPAFEPSGTVISFSQRGRLTADGIDGIRKPAPPAEPVSDAVWSAGGRLAVVRDGVIWAGQPGRLRRLAAGTDPSWSPDGGAIAAARHGWIVIIRVRDRRVRRLVRGTAPAYAPNGRRIAYVAPNHRLMIVAAGAGRPRPRAVGRIRAVWVDWQPHPRRRPAGCVAPPGATVLASSPAGVITGDGVTSPLDFETAPPVAYMGCLRSTGRPRLLERITGNSIDNASFVDSAVVAAPDAALVRDTEDMHYGGDSLTVQVFDLRTGRLRHGLGGESASCPGFSAGPCPGLDGVVLAPDGVSAAHVGETDPMGTLSTAIEHVSCAPASALCVAIDSSGTVLSSANAGAGAAAWTRATLDPTHQIWPVAVACPGSSLCVATGPWVFTSTNPTGGPSAWSLGTPAGSPGPIWDLSCPSTALCVGSLFNGRVATTTDPAAGAASWTISQIAPGKNLGAVFCSPQPRCFIADSAGTVYTSSDPAGGAGVWTASPGTPSFTSGSCPTANLCVLASGGALYTSTDPSAGTWSKDALSAQVSSVSCPTASLCVAAGYGGALATSTAPASGAWATATIDRGRNLQAIDCPSATLCAAVDATGHVVTASAPTGGPSAWTPALIDGDPCNDTTPCSIEQIQTSDATGLHTVDSSRLPGAGPFLTGLTLTGDTLTWSHAGSPRSVRLIP